MRLSAPNTALAALALAGTLVLGACAGDTADETETDAGTDATTTSAPDVAGGTADAAGETAAVDEAVDLEALPDPVAEVNGEPITREDLVQALEPELALAREQGQGPGGPAVDETALRDAVLDNMVSLELVRQEGERLDLEVTDEDVDAELDTLAAQNGMVSGEEFLTALEAQGVTEERAREEVGTLVLFDGILADRGGVPEPTEQDLKDYYEQLTGQSADEDPGGTDDDAAATDDPGQLPGFEEIRDQLEQQFAQQQQQEQLTAILEELRQDAEIELHV